MKKVLWLIVCLMTMVLSANAQTFSDRNKNVSFGIQLGAGDKHNHRLNFQTLMFNVSCYGAYLDIGGWPRSHGSDTRVGKWEDETSFAFHFGYQLPILNWLKITPLIGHYSYKFGYTNGYDWTVSRYGINNHFSVKERLDKFDYGANIQIDVNREYPSRLNIFGTFTRYMWYVGIGINIAPNNTKKIKSTNERMTTTTLVNTDFELSEI